LELAKDCSFRNIFVESDYEKIIKLINNGKEAARTYLGSVVSKIRNLKDYFDFACLFHVSRKDNNESHLLWISCISCVFYFSFDWVFVWMRSTKIRVMKNFWKKKKLGFLILFYEDDEGWMKMKMMEEEEEESK